MIAEEFERKKFEKWFEEDSYPLESYWFLRDSDGEYASKYVSGAWYGWSGLAKKIHWEKRWAELLVAFAEFDTQQEQK
jgi:hypothetical protein